MGQIKQQQHGDVAPIGAVAHVDAWVGRGPALEVDQAADGHVKVQLAALFLKADAHFVLRFQQIKHALQLLGQCGVPCEDAVDVSRVAAGVQALVQAHPVGPVGLAVVVPLGVRARGQAVHLGRAFAAAGFIKAAFFVALFNVDPQVAVVVAVVHLGVCKVHQRLLVALAADARHAAQRQASHVFGVALAVIAARH